MKKLYLLPIGAIFLLGILGYNFCKAFFRSPPPPIVQQTKQATLEAVNLTFSNTGNFSEPSMVLKFMNVPFEKEEVISGWHNDLSVRFKEKGAIDGSRDYSKIEPVIQTYMDRFKNSGASSVVLHFPNEDRALVLYRKDPQ